jgi:uncharacterized protein (DUF2384 family)
MPTAAPERLVQLDREVEEIKNGFVEVISQLQEVTYDDAFEERWRCIAARTRHLRNGFEADDFDKEQVLTVSKTLLDIYDLIEDRDSLDALDRLLVSFERIRHVVRDALDEHVNGIAGNAGEVLAELFERLPEIPQHEIADLVGVDRRTLLRWRESDRPPSWRLRVVARLVAILRHNWTPEGAISWFRRPRRDLDGRAPLDLLDRANIDEEALIAAARAGRSQYAT